MSKPHYFLFFVFSIVFIVTVEMYGTILVEKVGLQKGGVIHSIFKLSIFFTPIIFRKFYMQLTIRYKYLSIFSMILILIAPFAINEF